MMCAGTDVLQCFVCGCWCESDRTTRVKYDEAYVAERYDRYITTESMSELRLRVLEAVIDLYETAPMGEMFRRGGRLLDVGYGNGSFIREARRYGWDAYGYDVNPTEYEGVRRVDLPLKPLPSHERYRAITFFDALEHFEDLRWAPQLAANTDWLMISVPQAPTQFPWGQWKHRRPGEHHFYFNAAHTLNTIFSGPLVQAQVVYCANPEDLIRGSLPDGQPNILTCVLRCRPRGTK